MKKRTKILAGLVAAIIALSVVGFGFSQWSSEISLGGNVTAKGNWDVAISDAKVTSISTGTTVDGELLENVPTITLPAYYVYLTVYNETQYQVMIDDVNPIEVTVSQADLAAYSDELAVPAGGGSRWCYYKSGTGTGSSAGSIFFNVKLNEDGIRLGWDKADKRVPNTDNGAEEGTVIGVGICDHVAKNTTNGNPWKFVDDWARAEDFFAANPATSCYPAAISEDKLTATYSDVALTLPGAWAEYAVTVTNNGTANANLSEYKLALESESDVIVFSAPEIPANEILAPGESCTITFVASVPADYAEPTLDATATISARLVYVQDAVEPAPTPAHTH